MEWAASHIRVKLTRSSPLPAPVIELGLPSPALAPDGHILKLDELANVLFDVEDLRMLSNAACLLNYMPLLQNELHHAARCPSDGKCAKKSCAFINHRLFPHACACPNDRCGMCNTIVDMLHAHATACRVPECPVPECMNIRADNARS